MEEEEEEEEGYKENEAREGTPVFVRGGRVSGRGWEGGREKRQRGE